MEEKRICSKIMAGGVEYVVNFDERYLRLAADFPRKGDKGSWHDEKTKVSFDAINMVLDSKSSFKTLDFAHLFQQNSSNNGPLMVAVLLNEGVLRRGPHGQFYAGFKRL